MGNLVFLISLIGLPQSEAPKMAPLGHGKIAIGSSYQDMIKVIGNPESQREIVKGMLFLFHGKACSFEQVPCLVWTDEKGKIIKMQEINPEYVELKFES